MPPKRKEEMTEPRRFGTAKTYRRAAPAAAASAKQEHDESDDDNDEDPAAEKKVVSGAPQRIQLSHEQLAVVEDAVARKNVLVIAKAGSGKSSVALAAAQQFFEKHNHRTLLITYNARLKTETRERIARMSMDHAVEAHSYHAAASKFFVERKDSTGGADNALIHAACQNETPILPLDFGLIIIDEAQDMNELYSKFVVHILKHNKRKAVMMLVGDPFQRIFGYVESLRLVQPTPYAVTIHRYNGATCDYLIYPRKNFGALCETESFATHHLSICWRITHEMAKFINAHLNPCNLEHSQSAEWWKENRDRIMAWWGKGIRANPKRRAAPDSIKIVRGWGSRDIVEQTQRMFKTFGNDEVALLAYSLKGEKSPIRAIVDKLGKGLSENWAVLAGSSSSGDNLLKGKRLASTIHRMKGLERDGIVVCGMDAFIERIYTTDPLEHFNLFYVACTRAKKQLIVNETGTPYATVRCSPLTSGALAKHCCEVSHLAAYVPFDDILSVPENMFDARVALQFPEKALALDRQACLVEGRAAGTVEDLSPFMSRAISFRLMLQIHGRLFRIPVDTDSVSHDRTMVDFIHEFYQRTEADAKLVTWPLLVQYSVAYETLKSKYKHLWRQLTDYEAFTPSALLEKCSNNAMSLLWALAVKTNLVPATGVDESDRPARLRPFVDFEVPLAYPFYPKWFVGAFVGQISGVADMVFNGDTVVGVECSNGIPAERGLELSLYSSIRSLLVGPGKKGEAPPAAKTVMILTNTAQLVTVTMKIKPGHDKVPLEYELLHRAARRKLQLKPSDRDELQADYLGRNLKTPTAQTEKPRWMALFD